MSNSIAQQIISQGGVESYLKNQRNKSLLRFLTCGSVDDGKSTLIGRLLHDTKQIYEDQLFSLKNDSKRLGTQGDKLDLALLVDGLQAEREQGITIDVAYLYFSTEKRKFIIADTPGHEQYTRNMATGASTCDVAVLLIDARKGLLDQTRRHTFISTLLGIRHLIVAINKMDLVAFNEKIFKKICQKYLHFSKKISLKLKINFVPISALKGDNVVLPSNSMSWYSGPTLLSILESIEINNTTSQQPVRFPVQYVNRPNLDFRGYAGTGTAGVLRVGQSIKALPSGVHSTINRIVTFDGDIKEAWAGEAVTLVLKDDVDISRGDFLVDSSEIIEAVRNVQVDVVWMSEEPLVPGQTFDIKIAGKKTRSRVNNIQYQIDINTLSKQFSNKIPLNGIGLINLEFDELMILDKYEDYPTSGGMIFIDRFTNATVGAGMVRSFVQTTNKKNLSYDKFELELNSLVRNYFPHWESKNLMEDTSYDFRSKKSH